MNAVVQVIPHALLVRVGTEDAVENEELLALSRLDGQARRGGDGDG